MGEKMAYGYVVAQINVIDVENYTAYVKRVLATIEIYGGEFLVRGGKSESFEGTPPGDRNVVIQFPSYQSALDWYHSAEYAPVKKMRMAASTSVQTIVEGVD